MRDKGLLRKTVLVFLAVLLLLPTVAFGKANYMLDVQPIYQTDYPKPLFRYDGVERSVSSSGCGAVCVSMALTFLVPETLQTPEKLLLWTCERGLYKGRGLSLKALRLMLEANRIEVELAGKSIKKIRTALRQGNPIIAYMGEGTFTKNGHYVLICGIDRNDRLMVIDPNSKARSLRWYLQETIFDEMGATEGLLICRLP